MRVLYVIESRMNEAPWVLWPAQAPLSVEADAIAQAELLNSREPYPTRAWMAVRTFRAVARPVGCPKCFVEAIGPDCQYHVALGHLGATIDAPRPMPAPSGKMMPSPKVRRSPRGGYSPEAIETLRQHAQGEAVGVRVDSAGGPE
jgi:hypothetical protein